MKPWETLATAVAPDGSPMTLARRGDEYVLRAGGHVLMSSKRHASEERLAKEACARLSSRTAARVLVGGLGFGFTARAALDAIGPAGEVIIAELVPAVVQWNRELLAPLAGRPLEDPRTELFEGDVTRLLSNPKRRYDVILLDVDNGPFGLAQANNQHLYAVTGLHVAAAALAPKGVLGVWSAGADPRFVAKMEDAGLRVETLAAHAHEGGGSKHTLFLGTRAEPGGPRGRPRR